MTNTNCISQKKQKESFKGSHFSFDPNFTKYWYFLVLLEAKKPNFNLTNKTKNEP